MITLTPQQELLEAAIQIESALRDQLDIVSDTFCELCMGEAPRDMHGVYDGSVVHERDCAIGRLQRAIDALACEPRARRVA